MHWGDRVCLHEGVEGLVGVQGFGQECIMDSSFAESKVVVRPLGVQSTVLVMAACATVRG